MTVRVAVVSTSSLGDRSYVACADGVAVVVDPQRDVDRVLAVAGRHEAVVTHVAETHLHNDYVSGGLELARLTGATYLMAGDEEVAFDRTPVAEGDVVPVCDAMRLRVLATPGHTFHHVSYVLDEPDGAGGWAPTGVFTGGSLLFGTTGRTDLLGAEHATDLAYAQHRSARRLADLLPDGAQIWPTHGFGSFCSASQTDATDSTVGRERAENPVLRLAADRFVRETLAGLDAYPAYYAHTGAINQAGPVPVDLSPAAPADPAVIRHAIDNGDWVVDLRSRTAYAAAHLAGTVSVGLDGSMATWLGWLVRRGRPITLLAATPEEIAQAQRELVRIGVDRPSGAATGGPRDWAAGAGALRRLTLSDFPTLAALRRAPGTGQAPPPSTSQAPPPGTSQAPPPGTSQAPPPGTGQAPPPGDPPPADVILDVRLGNEWRSGHIRGAVHIPLYELPARLAQVPPGVVWVHCGSGYRSTIAASLLANAGRHAVVVNDLFTNAEPAGLPIDTGDQDATPADR